MSVQNSKNSPDNHLFDEMDGNGVPWDELSSADAARTEVPFNAFAEVAGDVIGNDIEAAMRVVLKGQKDLHAIASLFADDGRTEPTPLVEQVKEVLDYKSFYEILRGDQLMPQKARLQERDARATAGAETLNPDDPVWAELVANLKAIVSCEDEYPFTSMHRTEQWDLFTTSGFYSVYMDRGMTETQITRVIRNVINCEPQEKWLEGVFDHVQDEHAEERKAFHDILSGMRELDSFDRAVANLRRQHNDDGLSAQWSELSEEQKVRYLTTFAQAYDVPVDRFVKAAQHILGGVELTGDDEWFVRSLHGKELAMRKWERAIFDDRHWKPEKTQERGGREM